MAVGEITTLTEPEWASDTISADAAAGATSLEVRNVTPFEPLEAGEVGWLVVPDEAGVEYAEGLRFSEPFTYTAITDAEDDSGTLTIPGGLPVAVEADDDVWLWDPDAPGVDKRSVTMLVYARQDEPPRSQPVPVLVPHEQITVAGADALLGANVEFDYAGPDDEYPTVTHVYDRDAALDLSKAVPGTLDGTSAFIPGTEPSAEPVEAPSVSPSLTVAGTAETLVITADPVAYSSRIEFHVSTEDGFTPDASTLLKTTNSNIITVATLPGGARLEPETTYYFRTVAVNAAGEAAPSTQASGQLDPNRVGELALAVVTAGIVMAARFQSGNGYWDPDEGIILPQPDGTVTRLSTDGVTPSVLAGFAVLIGATIKDNLSIYGLAQLFGRMEMPDGVPDPRVPASLSRTWASAATQGWVDNGESHGLCLSPDNRWAYVGTFGGFFLALVDRTTGETEVPFLTGHNANFVPRGGITRIGNTYYVLGEDWDRDYRWYVYKFDATTYAKTDEFLVSDDPAMRPAVGNNGTNVLIAYCRGNGNDFYVHAYSPTGSSVSLTGYPHGQGAVFDVAGVAVGSFDLGATYVIIAPAQGRDPFAYSGGIRDSVSEFPRAAGNQMRGLAWDGTRFYSIDTTGTVWEYASGHPTASTVYGGYTWYDGDPTNGPHETAVTAGKAFLWPARTRLTITGQPAPHAEITDPSQADKANLLRFYAGPSASTMRLQATGGVGATEVTLTAGLNTGSAVAPIASTFDDSSNAPGWFGSAAKDGAGKALTAFDGAGAARAAKLIQSGYIDVPVSAASTATGTLTFPVPFDAPPAVTFSSSHRYWTVNRIGEAAATGIDLRVYHVTNTNQTVTVRVHWIAAAAA